MLIDKICLAENDPVLGHPTVDGFTGIEDAGVLTTDADPGYGLGHRINYGNGSFFPPMVFQGVKGRGEDYLYLSFFVRYGLSFDDEDVIIIALRENAASQMQDATVRRIDIYPVRDGVGASGPVADDTVDMNNRPLNADYHIRSNRPSFNIEHKKGQTNGNPWANNPAPNNLTVKVRSWQPPANPPFSEFAWSVEVRIPRNKIVGGNDWIDLNDGFGLYFNVFRLSKSTNIPFVVQYTFPYDTNNSLARAISAGDIGDDFQQLINPAWYGRVGLPSLVQGTNCGQGVRFVNASENSIGVRSAQNSGALSNQIVAKNSSGDPIPAYLVAQVENTSQTDTANGVKAEFRFANWGLGPQNFFAWNPPPGLSNNPTAAHTVNSGNSGNPGAPVELIANWPAGSVPQAYQSHSHQCMWVQLDSPNGVNFIQASMRRNMDFVGLSEYERPAYISGVGYQPPKDGSGHHEFVLFTHVRKIVTLAREGRNIRALMGHATPTESGYTQSKGMTHWIWTVNGYRRTGETVDVKGKTFEILDDSPGAFGYVASHEGTTDVLTYELSGGGLKHAGGAMYSLKVPDGGEVKIHTRLKAAPPSHSRKLPWWIWLILILLLILGFILLL